MCILSLFTSTFQLALHRSANAPPAAPSDGAAPTAAALRSYGPLCAVVRPVGWLVCGGGLARGLLMGAALAAEAALVLAGWLCAFLHFEFAILFDGTSLRKQSRTFSMCGLADVIYSYGPYRYGPYRYGVVQSWPYIVMAVQVGTRRRHPVEHR